DLSHPGPDDLCNEASGCGLEAVPTHLPDVDALLGRDHLRQRVSVVQLQGFSLEQRRPEADRDVVGHGVAAKRQHGIGRRGARVVDDHVGRPGPDVDQTHTQVDLVRTQHALARCQALTDDVLDVEACLVDALDDVLNRCVRTGHDVCLDLETVARHADGFLDALLTIHRECPGQDVYHLPVAGHADSPRCLDHALHVVVIDLAILAGYGDHAAAVLRVGVRTSQGSGHGLPSHARPPP